MGLTRRQLLKRSSIGLGAVLFAGCAVPEREMVAQSPGRIPEDLVEGFDAQENYIMTGRLASQAPDIDGQVILEKCEAEPGEIISVLITAAADYDLVAEPVSKTD